MKSQPVIDITSSYRCATDCHTGSSLAPGSSSRLIIPCAIACINICVHVKNPNTGSHTIVWTHGNTAHTLIGMASAARAALNCALSR